MSISFQNYNFAINIWAYPFAPIENRDKRSGLRAVAFFVFVILRFAMDTIKENKKGAPTMPFALTQLSHNQPVSPYSQRTHAKEIKNVKKFKRSDRFR